MRKQDQLSALINQLNPNEKRYFKLHASLHTGDKTFLRLFDELSKNKIYEPEQLSTKLNISKPLLGHSKKYLEEVLFGALRQYEQDNDLRVWLNNQWQVVRLLNSRNQLELAFSVNEKALEKAMLIEDFLMTYRFALYHCDFLKLFNRQPEALKASPLMALSLQQLIEKQEIVDLNTLFGPVATGGRGDKRLLGAIAKNPIFKTKPEKLKSNTARMLWHEMKQNYYFFVKGDLETAVYHNLCKLKIYDAHPGLIYANANSFLGCMMYLSSHYVDLGNYEQALKYAVRLQLETGNRRKDIPANFCSAFNLIAYALQIYALGHAGKYADVVKKTNEIEHKMAGFSADHLVIVKHHYATALFYTGKYREALKVCEDIHTGRPDRKIEEQFYNRILIVMIHHAMKNYSLVPHFVQSAASWAKRHSVTMPGTDELIGWFRKFEKLRRNEEPLFFKKFYQAVQKNIFKNYTRELGLKTWAGNNLVRYKLEVQ